MSDVKREKPIYTHTTYKPSAANASPEELKAEAERLDKALAEGKWKPLDLGDLRWKEPTHD